MMEDNPTQAIVVYRPKEPVAMKTDIYVKFAQNTHIIDPWWLFGGTRWSRTLFRLKHPIVYSKRGLRNLYRSMRRLFIKDKLNRGKKWGDK